MQERYLGDTHDFVKYALLRHLHGSLKLRLGVKWFLTHPESNNDGNQRAYRKENNKTPWIKWNAELFKALEVFEKPEERLIKNVASHKILPADTLYFEDIVPTSNRTLWHERGMSALSGADIVFLDPDNGFEVKSASSKKLPKYSLYSEAVDYHKQGKIVVSIQFARQCCPERKALDIRANLYEQASYTTQLPVLRGRVAPNILFIFLAPPAHISKLMQTLINFSAMSEGKAELIY